jgi:hypothetical protein
MATSDNDAGLQVSANNKITIIGSGTLNATSGYAGAGIGGSTGGAGGTINIGGSATVTAKVVDRGYFGGAGIGGGKGGVGGHINIGGSARVTASGNQAAASIGGANNAGGNINIGGNARVTAAASYFTNAGIGAGFTSSDCNITIGGNARISATGGPHGGAGIGGGRISNSSGGGTAIITITGNAFVYARGGSSPNGGNGAGAGIGTGLSEIENTTGTLNLTIKPEGIYTPTVIARGGNSNLAAGIGASAETRFNGFINIEGGFVVAYSSGTPAAQSIGYSNVATGNGTVTISGGSVYATNVAINPAPKNASGTPVFPLYVPAALGNRKIISVTSPANTVKTIGKVAARFLSTGFWTEAGSDQFPTTAVDADLFPHALSATLWRPEGAYIGITDIGANYFHADVTAELVPYTPGGNNRLLKLK